MLLSRSTRTYRTNRCTSVQKRFLKCIRSIFVDRRSGTSTVAFRTAPLIGELSYFKLTQHSIPLKSKQLTKTRAISMLLPFQSFSPTSNGVPKESVLRLAFPLYTTPVTHLVHASDINHNLLADDTALYIIWIRKLQ